MTPSILEPPSCVQGMTTLDKSKFTKEIAVPVFNIKGSSVHMILTSLKFYLLKLDKLKPIQPHESDTDDKVVFLNPDLVRDFDSFADDVKECLKEIQIMSSNLYSRNITLTYDNWKAHEIIAAVLPSPLSFSGFSTIGTIIHLNLKDDLLPYKHIIAEVLLEKMKNCKSVVNKIKTIDNTYRNFEMEVLAGSDDLKTETKENGCRFELDFAKVYWNPRLHEEHGRVVGMLKEGDVLYDVFCGIGPFAIPAAKSKCEVLANDLNPACCQWLERNKVINKIPSGLTIFNKSGDMFIKEDFKKNYLECIGDIKYKKSKFYVTMNLPSTAYTFLTAFVHLFHPSELSSVQDDFLPIVHLYCFIRCKEKAETKAKELVEQTLHTSITNDLVDVCNVRNVAPNKEMIRVSFRLNKALLTGTKHLVDETEPNCFKKPKLDLETNGLKQKFNSDDLDGLITKKLKSN